MKLAEKIIRLEEYLDERQRSMKNMQSIHPQSDFVHYFARGAEGELIMFRAFIRSLPLGEKKNV